MHLLESIRNLLEGRAQPLLERRLQLLIDRRAHFVELLGILVAQQVEALFERRTHRIEALLVGLGELQQGVAGAFRLAGLSRRRRGELLLHCLLELGQALAEDLELVALRAAMRCELLLGELRELHHPLPHLAAQCLRGVRLLVARNGKILPQVALEIDPLLLQNRELRCHGSQLALRFVPAATDTREPDQYHQRDHRTDRRQYRGDKKQRGAHKRSIQAVLQ